MLAALAWTAISAVFRAAHLANALRRALPRIALRNVSWGIGVDAHCVVRIADFPSPRAATSQA